MRGRLGTATGVHDVRSRRGDVPRAGPFDLSDAVDGAWDFDLWTDIDDGGSPATQPTRWMGVVARRSTLLRILYVRCDQGLGARHGQDDGRAHGDGTPVLGQSRVYFAFVFVSDGATQKEGAYIDNVVIKKIITEPVGATHRARRHLSGR